MAAQEENYRKQIRKAKRDRRRCRAPCELRESDLPKPDYLQDVTLNGFIQPSSARPRITPRTKILKLNPFSLTQHWLNIPRLFLEKLAYSSASKKMISTLVNSTNQEETRTRPPNTGPSAFTFQNPRRFAQHSATPELPAWATTHIHGAILPPTKELPTFWRNSLSGLPTGPMTKMLHLRISRATDSLVSGLKAPGRCRSAWRSLATTATKAKSTAYNGCSLATFVAMMTGHQWRAEAIGTFRLDAPISA